MSDLLATIERRRNAILAQWARSWAVQVAVEHPSALGRLVFIEDTSVQADVGALGRRSPNSVVIVDGGGPPDLNASVWVASGYEGYNPAYLAFVRRIYGIDATPADFAGYDADHLLNRARAPRDTTFIRLEAVRSDINRTWGATFEKAASNPEFYANRERERRTMSWAICAKLGHQMPPSGPGDTVGIARLGDFFRSIGFSRDEAMNGMAEMTRFAYSLR